MPPFQIGVGLAGQSWLASAELCAAVVAPGGTSRTVKLIRSGQSAHAIDSHGVPLLALALQVSPPPPHPPARVRPKLAPSPVRRARVTARDLDCFALLSLGRRARARSTRHTLYLPSSRVAQAGQDATAIELLRAGADPTADAAELTLPHARKRLNRKSSSMMAGVPEETKSPGGSGSSRAIGTKSDADDSDNGFSSPEGSKNRQLGAKPADAERFGLDHRLLFRCLEMTESADAGRALVVEALTLEPNALCLALILSSVYTKLSEKDPSRELVLERNARFCTHVAAGLLRKFSWTESVIVLGKKDSHMRGLSPIDVALGARNFEFVKEKTCQKCASWRRRCARARN